jgi:glycine/sarcosine N-methyltransferase
LEISEDVQMTEKLSGEDVPLFYDRLADGYDAMTGFEGRFAKERPAFQSLIGAHRIRTAVDAGAGTGFHSLLLAQLGVDVTALDISRRMLESLSRHAATMGLDVKTVEVDLTAAPAQPIAQADAVFCMGNTLAHCLSEGALEATLRGFKRMLCRGGILFVQILNYRMILKARDRLLSVKEAGGCRFTRMYEYREPLIRFTITREDLSNRLPVDVVAVDLYPLVETELENALCKSGFERIQKFGSIAMEPYDATGSHDLVVMAHCR